MIGKILKIFKTLIIDEIYLDDFLSQNLNYFIK